MESQSMRCILNGDYELGAEVLFNLTQQLSGCKYKELLIKSRHEYFDN